MLTGVQEGSGPVTCSGAAQYSAGNVRHTKLQTYGPQLGTSFSVVLSRLSYNHRWQNRRGTRPFRRGSAAGLSGRHVVSLTEQTPARPPTTRSCIQQEKTRCRIE